MIILRYGGVHWRGDWLQLQAGKHFLSRCEESNCLNGALCLVEEGEQRCYCVPDYHGPRCQYKYFIISDIHPGWIHTYYLRYNECQLPPGPKCLHGGLCQDEVDDFICACQEGYSGTYCECQMGDNSTLTDDQCVDINTTLSWTLPPDLMIDMEEDYDGVVVAGTSVTVDFEDVTEVAGTVVPLEGTTEGDAVMATSSWEGVEPTPTMAPGTEQTTSATPDFTREEELAVDVELTTPTLNPSYTDMMEAEDTGATPSLGPEEEVDRGGDATSVSTLPPSTPSISEEEGRSTTQSSNLRPGEETTRVTTLSSVEGGATIGPTPAAACKSNVCKNGGTCLTR